MFWSPWVGSTLSLIMTSILSLNYRSLDISLVFVKMLVPFNSVYAALNRLSIFYSMPPSAKTGAFFERNACKTSFLLKLDSCYMRSILCF